jgi:hypothetical protein
VFKSILVAVPGKRYRITRVGGRVYRYLLVELWWPRDGVWLVASHVRLDADLTEQDIERAVMSAVDTYVGQDF